MANSSRLSRSFFSRPTLRVARELLGRCLVRLEANGQRATGLITECEAYIGGDDLGCHARSGQTRRNRSMWGPPGHAYVYFTYGMHWMFNIVTEAQGFPAAVLIRGVFPLLGLDTIRLRRQGKPFRLLADGPAKVCQAFAIDGDLDGLDLCDPSASLYLEEGIRVPNGFVTTGPRVGLNTVPEPWKSIPWNFRIETNLIQRLIDERSK